MEIQGRVRMMLSRNSRRRCHWSTRSLASSSDNFAIEASNTVRQDGRSSAKLNIYIIHDSMNKLIPDDLNHSCARKGRLGD